MRGRLRGVLVRRDLGFVVLLLLIGLQRQAGQIQLAQQL
jgi:hypothetical protein